MNSVINSYPPRTKRNSDTKTVEVFIVWENHEMKRIARAPFHCFYKNFQTVELSTKQISKDSVLTPFLRNVKLFHLEPLFQNNIFETIHNMKTIKFLLCQRVILIGSFPFPFRKFVRYQHSASVYFDFKKYQENSA